MVIPRRRESILILWIPASAGMTDTERLHLEPHIIDRMSYYRLYWGVTKVMQISIMRRTTLNSFGRLTT